MNSALDAETLGLVHAITMNSNDFTKKKNNRSRKKETKLG